MQEASSVDRCFCSSRIPREKPSFRVSWVLVKLNIVSMSMRETGIIYMYLPPRDEITEKRA